MVTRIDSPLRSVLDVLAAKNSLTPPIIMATRQEEPRPVVRWGVAERLSRSNTTESGVGRMTELEMDREIAQDERGGDE